MKQSGTADLKLMGGAIPKWLFTRMEKLSFAIVESIIENQGHSAFLSKLSNPFWFQSFASVIGMDWNSSGATTAVMSALRNSINPHSKEMGLYICGGKGKDSLKTPKQLLEIGDKTGLDGYKYAKASKLVAKVDNTAIQDKHNLYMHYFLISATGEWTVIQQGMEPKTSSARRYHWHSQNIKSFTEEPHTAICGENKGEILNLTHKDANATKAGILNLTEENPEKLLKEIPKLIIPKYHEIKAKDIDQKRLGSILWLAQENETNNFEDLLLLKGLGPRTLQSMTLVSELINGTPSRFSDPARFSMAHGAKGGKPFPVPTKVYDEVIENLDDAVKKAKLGKNDKNKAIKKLHQLAKKAEEGFTPNHNFDKFIEKEKRNSWKYGGRSIAGKAKKNGEGEQLKLDF